ncbi:MAG: CBS domain-containing protein [Bradymonadaceae bacterium]|nr:CBS domain-containing protein [Lujinxingiaceae bacterium]
MGEHDVNGQAEGEELRQFMKRLLRDVRAMEYMLDNDVFETGIRRIGAEQELFLVDGAFRPAPLALKVLETLDDAHFTTELGIFNLEFNLEPKVFGGCCLREMEREVAEFTQRAREAAREHGGSVVLTGILPTLQKSDLGLDNMTPIARYRALNDAMTRLRGGDYEFYIQGADEFIVKHDSVMLESCNTSFQVHFQVAPNEFSRLYNIAQAIAAPVMAVASNSPLLFGKRLWHETRIPLLEQSVDTRASTHHMRELNPRVMFGNRWVDNSVLEIFREDISRFRLLFATQLDEDPFEALDAGRIPSLKALCLHNGTVYRWNRPCYGILDGVPHLRIENRVFPAGPTPIDEMANAAFWFGLMSGVAEEYGDITRVMDFDVARHNFYAAARLGLEAPVTAFDGSSLTVRELTLQSLLPLARQGLRDRDIDSSDVDRYMGVIEERVTSRQTGASWLLQSFGGMKGAASLPEKLSVLTSATARRQVDNQPVHTWPLATSLERTSWRDNYLRVEQYMTTDLFTVNEDELIDLVACVMDWQHLRHVPVEDNEHRLVGLVTHRTLLRLLANGKFQDKDSVPVGQIMQRELVVISPQTRTVDAIALLRERRISCLPVVNEGKLVGIVTERDFMDLARDLLEERLREEGQ